MSEPVDLEAVQARYDDAWVEPNGADKACNSMDDIPFLVAEIRELRDSAYSDVDRIIALEDVRRWALDEIARLERVNARLEAQVKFLHNAYENLKEAGDHV